MAFYDLILSAVCTCILVCLTERVCVCGSGVDVDGPAIKRLKDWYVFSLMVANKYPISRGVCTHARVQRGWLHDCFVVSLLHPRKLYDLFWIFMHHFSSPDLTHTDSVDLAFFLSPHVLRVDLSLVFKCHNQWLIFENVMKNYKELQSGCEILIFMKQPHYNN